MTRASPLAMLSPALRVALAVRDDVLRRRIEQIATDHGHLVTDSDPEVTLTDDADTILPRAVVLSDMPSDAPGHLPLDATPAQLDAALRGVAAGLHVRAERSFAPAREPVALLTPREMEILGEIGGGLPNKGIARRLGISQHTVKFHVESLLRKLGARSRAEAVAKGLEHARRTRVEI